MTIIMLYLLMIFLLITAFFIVFNKNTIHAVIIYPIFGALLVVIFVILQAPGVALAEAVMSAGLTTGFFVITVHKTEI